MATVLFEGVFDQILQKRLKMTVFETLFQICASSSPTFEGQSNFSNFPHFFIYPTWIGKNLAGFS